MHSLPVWIIDVKLMKLLCLPFVKKDWEYLETDCLYYELCKAFMFREHSCRLRRRTSTLTIRLTRDVLQVWIILVTSYDFIQFSRSLNFTRSEAGWCRTSQKLSSVNLCLQSGPSQCCKLSSCYRDTRDIFSFRSLSCAPPPLRHCSLSRCICPVPWSWCCPGLGSGSTERPRQTEWPWVGSRETSHWSDLTLILPRCHGRTHPLRYLDGQQVGPAQGNLITTSSSDTELSARFTMPLPWTGS